MNRQQRLERRLILVTALVGGALYLYVCTFIDLYYLVTP